MREDLIDFLVLGKRELRLPDELKVLPVLSKVEVVFVDARKEDGFHAKERHHFSVCC